MSRSARYLRQDVMAEPLFHQWFTLFPLVPPAMAPMFVANSHIKVLRSFVDSPRMHASALKNPAFAGGPFVNVAPERAGEIKALLERTVKDAAPLLEFAEAIKALEALLHSQAKGNSLEPLYPKVPPALRGYVELNYNLNHNATFRVIEGLLYNSRYYQEQAQSVMLSVAAGDARPFVMSTPRLDAPDNLQLRVPYRAAAVDRLFRMRSVADDVDEMAAVLEVPADKRALFDGFFTDEAPPPCPAYRGPGVRVRFFGHACVLLESADTNILIDPLISYRYPTDLSRYTYADLPERIDHVLLTHIHADHVVIETLMQLRHKIGTVVVPRSSGNGYLDPSLKWMLQRLGFPDVRELDEFETLEVQGGTITGVPFFGEHCDLDVRAKIAHFIRLAGRTFLAATDSNALEPALYDHARDILGELDVLLLGTESEGAAISYGYGNLFTRPIPREIDQTRRQNGSNSQSAIAIIEKLRPRQVQNYAMGLEPWLKHLFPVAYTEKSPQIIESNKLLGYCREKGVPAHRPFGQHELLVS